MGQKDVSEWLVGKSDLTSAAKEREERGGEERSNGKDVLGEVESGRYDTMVQSLSHTEVDHSLVHIRMMNVIKCGVEITSCRCKREIDREPCCVFQYVEETKIYLNQIDRLKQLNRAFMGG